MLPGRGKQKGNVWENLVAKDLSLWLTNGIRADTLERSPTSGGKSTVYRKAGERFSSIAGDLISVSEESQKFIDTFIVECKHRASIGLEQLIWTPSCAECLGGWWKKLLGECEFHKKLPIIVAKQNNRFPLIVFSKEGLQKFPRSYHTNVLFVYYPSGMYFLDYTNFLTLKYPGF